MPGYLLGMGGLEVQKDREVAEEVGHSLGKVCSRMDTSTFGAQVTLCSQTMGYTLGLTEEVSHALAFITQKSLRYHP